MQTLKRPVEKPKPEIVIEEIALELKNVRNHFKPTVQTRRVEFDEEVEEELSLREQEEEIERLSKFFPSTRDFFNAEVKKHKNAFDNAVRDFEHKNEYNKKDQEDLRKSDEVLLKKMNKLKRFENLRRILDDEIKVRK